MSNSNSTAQISLNRITKQIQDIINQACEIIGIEHFMEVINQLYQKMAQKPIRIPVDEPKGSAQKWVSIELERVHLIQNDWANKLCTIEFIDGSMPLIINMTLSRLLNHPQLCPFAQQQISSHLITITGFALNRQHLMHNLQNQISTKQVKTQLLLSKYRFGRRVTEQLAQELNRCNCLIQVKKRSV